jgi:hypothetical protein
VCSIIVQSPCCPFQHVELLAFSRQRRTENCGVCIYGSDYILLATCTPRLFGLEHAAEDLG